MPTSRTILARFEQTGSWPQNNSYVFVWQIKIGALQIDVSRLIERMYLRRTTYLCLVSHQSPLLENSVITSGDLSERRCIFTLETLMAITHYAAIKIKAIGYLQEIYESIGPHPHNEVNLFLLEYRTGTGKWLVHLNRKFLILMIGVLRCDIIEGEIILHHVYWSALIYAH